MFLKPLKRIQQTLGFRLTAWYSGLFTLSTLALFATAYVLLSSSLERRDREALQLKLKEYAAEYQRGGMEATARKIAFENGQAGKALFLFALPGQTTKLSSSLSPSIGKTSTWHSWKKAASMLPPSGYRSR